MRHPRLARTRPLRRPPMTAARGERAQVVAAAPAGPDPYRAMFERSQAVQFLVDPDTSAIVDANPAACAFYGYTHNALRAMRNTDLSCRTPDQVRADMQVAKTRQAGTFHSQHRLANGEIRDVQITLSILEIAARPLLHANIIDVTERRRTERLLRIQYDLGAALAETSDLTTALRLTLEAALQIEGVDAGGVYLADPRTGGLDLAVHQGLSPQFVAQVAHYDAASTRAQAAQAGPPCIPGRWNPAAPMR
jgi:PAS domain S-box-containing protein